jgi:hypothetical protein
MKRNRWNNPSGIIKLAPQWREEMIKAFTKYKMPYKKRIRDLEKALESGKAVIV